MEESFEDGMESLLSWLDIIAGLGVRECTPFFQNVVGPVLAPLLFDSASGVKLPGTKCLFLAHYFC